MSDGQQASMGTARRQPLLVCLLSALLVLLLLLGPAQAADSNPYSVLGLTRGATLTEIKKAYRRLSKQWHPDKSDDPTASERFVAINAAYDILSDQQKRDEFDRYGRVTSEQQQQRQPQHQQQAGFHWSWGSQSVFQSYAAYTTNTDPLSSSSPQLHKLSADNYDTFVLSHSVSQQRTPEVWLVEVYAEVCNPCAAVHTAFAQTLRLLKEMELSAVVKLGAVHADFESRLVHQLGLRSVPHVFSISTDRWRQQQARTLVSRSPSHAELLQHLSSIFIASLPPQTLTLLHRLPLSANRPLLSLMRDAVRPPHPSRPVLFLVSSVSSSPSLLLSYVMAYHAADFSFCYLHMSSLPSRPVSLPDIGSALHIAASELHRMQSREQDSIFVFNGDAAAPLSHVASFASTAPVSSVLRLLSPRLHVVAPPLTVGNYYSLCVRRGQRSSSPPAETSELSIAGKKACLVLLAASQQQADTTLFPALLHRPVLSSASALLQQHNLQLSWLDPARQAAFVLFFSQQHRSQQTPRALLLRAQTGQFAMWTPDRRAGDAAEALHDWAHSVLEGDGDAWQDGWRAGGWPVLEAEASAWSAAGVEEWLLQLRDSLRGTFRLPADVWKRLSQLDFGMGLMMAVAALLVCFTLLLSAS